jgi:hypothetical protein
MQKDPLSSPYILFAGTLLLAMALLSGGAALRESVTIDEVAHLGAGVSYLQRLDLRMNPEHPPLAKVLAAFPLVLRGVRADYKDPAWAFSETAPNNVLGEWSFGHSIIARWNDPFVTITWARAPMLLLTLGLGFLLYWCASRLGDVRGGLLCLAMFISAPVFLAFGPLVLTDIAVTFFSVLAIWTYAEMWRSPGRSTVIRFALALAGALLSKFSAGLLLIACVAFGLSLRWLPLPLGPSGRRVGWRNTGKAVVLAALIVYAMYFVLSWNQPSTTLQFLGQSKAALGLRRLLMPPLVFGTGLFAFASLASRPTFILGHAYSHGVWFYFPVLFVLKSTLAFLALLLLTLAIAIFATRRFRSKPCGIAGGMELHWRAVWISLLVFTIACVLSRLDISIRHFSVPLALLMLLLAPLPRILESLRHSGWRPTWACGWAAAALAAASLIAAVRAYPYYIPFLNSLSFGYPGYHLVNGANLDWNQSLTDVRRFVELRHVQSPRVDEDGYSDPAIYIPGAHIWNCQQPASADAGQWVFVSADMIEDSHNCTWLLQYPHQALAGESMYAFQVPAQIPPAGAPGGPPLPRDYRNFAGIPGSWPDLRLIFLRGSLDPKQLPAAMHQLLTLGQPAAP